MSERSAQMLVTLFFFVWGFMANLNSFLMPRLRATLALPYSLDTLIPVVYFSACFFLAYPSAQLVANRGYKWTMAVGLAIMAAGTFAFVPAAHLGHLWSFALALAVLATGSAVLQTAAGPYISLLGNQRGAASRFSLALGVNSLGSLLAVPFGSWLVLSTDRAAATTYDLTKPYLILAASIALLAGLIGICHLPVPRQALDLPLNAKESTVDPRAARKRLLHSAAALFIYVGAEVTVSQLLVDYLSAISGSGRTLDHSTAALWTGLFWLGFVIGRVGGGVLFRHVQPLATLTLVSWAAAALVAVSVCTTGVTARVCIAGVGLFGSVMVPILFTHGIKDLGAFTTTGTSIMVGAVLGGAVFPFLTGVLADHVGLHRAFLIPALAFVYVAVFSASQPASATLSQPPLESVA